MLGRDAPHVWEGYSQRVEGMLPTCERDGTSHVGAGCSLRLGGIRLPMYGRDGPYVLVRCRPHNSIRGEGTQVPRRPGLPLTVGHTITQSQMERVSTEPTAHCMQCQYYTAAQCMPCQYCTAAPPCSANTVLH